MIVNRYNLPPKICMSKPYMFLSCLILGPSNPKAFIDLYFEPLIDYLKKLCVCVCWVLVRCEWCIKVSEVRVLCGLVKVSGGMVWVP